MYVTQTASADDLATHYDPCDYGHIAGSDGPRSCSLSLVAVFEVRKMSYLFEL